MGRLALSVVVVLLTCSVASADWRLYRKGGDVIATFDYLSRLPYHGQPSLWVNWRYVVPKNGVGGVRLQVTADCKEHRLYGIASYPYDVGGNYLKPVKRYTSPREFPISPGSLNEATYNLICK